jgi:predicted Zn finger-like uncharacterized protein
MKLICPQCATRYQADAAKFPPAGRAVRCGKCRHVWHQLGFATEPEPVAAPITDSQNLLSSMILTCPQCTASYQADIAKFPPVGRAVRCGKCRHVWHQPGFAAGPEPVAPQITDIVSKAGLPAAATQSSTALAPLSAEAAPVRSQPSAVAAEQPKASRFVHLAPAAGWVLIIAVVVLVTSLAVRYRRDIAMVWPQSAPRQSLLGHSMDKPGINLRNVGYRREIDDGQTMLVITGTIANSTDRELPAPKMIRVTLSDANNNKLFDTAFPPHLATLGPRQSVTFRTRIPDVPSATLHLQMRLDAS